MSQWTLPGVGLIASTIDQAFIRLMQRSGKPRRRPDADAARRLAEVTAFYDGLGETFFPAPPPIAPEVRPVRAAPRDDREVVDLVWESSWLPAYPQVRDKYLAYAANRRVWARLLRHRSPRPAVICLHGYGGGRLAVEEWTFSARWLHSIGLDVALMALPFHGPRAERSGAPVFPNAGRITRTNEGFGQAVFDVRALAGWLGERGASRVGLAGLSLGGYTSALLATVDPRLAFVVLLVPFASYAELVWRHGEHHLARRAAMEAGITREMLDAAFAIHTPTRRAPVIGGDRVMVVAGAADRVTTEAQARVLRAHFGAGPFHTFPGGHLLQVGRSDALREVARFLAGHGLLPARNR